MSAHGRGAMRRSPHDPLRKQEGERVRAFARRAGGVLPILLAQLGRREIPPVGLVQRTCFERSRAEQFPG